MATLKDHQQAMVNLLASGSGIPASAMRLAHAMHDVLEVIAGSDLMQVVQKEQLRVKQLNDATTPGLNDKALAADVEACRPKVTHFDVEINLADMDEVKMTLQNMQSHLDGARDSQRKAERRVKELENTVKQLRANNAKLRAENGALKATLEFAETQTTEVKFMAEQAGCRKDDTHLPPASIPCDHPEGRVDTNIGFCSKCGQYL